MVTRERIMTFVAEELPKFLIKTIKHSTFKTYSVSIMSGPGPFQILP